MFNLTMTIGMPVIAHVAEHVPVICDDFPRIDMYSEGLMDLMEMMMMLPFTKDVKPKLDNIESKAKERFLPVFEKVCVYGVI